VGQDWGGSGGPINPKVAVALIVIFLTLFFLWQAGVIK